MVGKTNSRSSSIFVGAHPDDIEAGCLGTIMYLIKQRNEDVYCIVATDGEAGVDNSVRLSRLERSMKALGGAGVKKENITFMHLPDTLLDANRISLFSKIEVLCIKNPVKRVFLQSNKDAHQDHRAVYDAGISAARNVGMVLAYESNASTTTEFSPTYFVGIDPYIKSKLKLLEHNGKTQNDARYKSMDCLEALARHRGMQSKVASHAEAFEVLRMGEA